jgi:Mrp family chromosome partitioning ATPase
LGEIADALRRAREAQPWDGRREPRAAIPSPPATSAPDPLPRASASGIRARAAATPARVLDHLASADPVLALGDEITLDAYRRVALRIRTALARANSRSLAVVSAVRGEGKTTLACDLAIAMASLCKEGEVALVDLDLRSPSIARRLGVDIEVGVEQFLSGDVEFGDPRVVIHRPSLELYPVAAPVREAHELLVSARFAQLIRDLEARHSVVLIDTPATLVASDTAMILERVAACVLVARFGVTRMRNFRQLVASLPRAKILGQLMNGVRVPRHRYYDYYEAEILPEEAGPGSAAEGPEAR